MGTPAGAGAAGEQLRALQSAVDRHRGAGEGVSRGGAQAVGALCVEGGAQVFQQLEALVDSDAYLQELAAARRQQEPAVHGTEVFREAWWATAPPLAAEDDPAAAFEQVTHAAAGVGPREEEEETGPFVIVQEQDVLEALGAFIASYLASLPETRALEPAELQRALKGALQELQKSRARRLFDCARVLYRVSTLSFGALTLFENPLCRALLGAVWSFGRVMLGFR